MRENRTQGSARGAPGNGCPFLNHLTEMTREDAYQRILTIGLIAIRDHVTFAGVPRLTQIEAEHLHNIPSLLGEANPYSHEYYYTKERPHYIESIESEMQKTYSDFTIGHYLDPWDALASCLKFDQEIP